jgi:hypothetical protein
VHYTDTREGQDPAALASEIGSYLTTEGFHESEVVPIAAGIEDSFMLLMGSPDDEAGS